MRAASLFVVLVLAKALTLAGRDVSVTPWTFIAYVWQDALTAIVIGTIDAACRSPRIGWAIYGLLVAYVAVNVPITLVLASPLTWPMIHAARGPLADSITRYLVLVNLGSLALVVVAGVLLPLLMRRVRRLVPVSLLLAAILGAAGAGKAATVETVGLDRNAVTALLSRGLPRVEASSLPTNWRVSPLAASLVTSGDARRSDPEDLTRYRGVARGLNVLVVILESTGARYLRPYGATEDPMPNLTALARHAVVFDNAYSVYPESIKGLFATLCSRYPAFDVAAEAHANVPCSSVAGIAGDAGYRTALFHSGRFRYLGMQEILEHKGFGLLEDAGAIGGSVRSSFGVDEPATVSRIFQWIDSQDSTRPFFVTYLPIAGHHPYAIPESARVVFPADTDLGRYRNALHYEDEALGELLSGLHTRGLDSRTLVVVFGDHGEAFEQHPGNIGHTLFINEENVRVPYMIEIPGTSGTLGTSGTSGTSGTRRVHRVVSLLDTAPTILDLLGLPPALEHQGLSLLRPGERMALFYTDYSLGWLGLRDGCFKYLFEINAGRSKLFDVCSDPDEAADISSNQPERVRAYRGRVIEWSAAQQALIR
jgi:arylsulfatase A-like enzyme